MKLSSDKLRNVALAAHGGSGKTSLAEALIFNAGASNRLGRVEEGNTVMDYTEEEQRRTASLSSAFFQYEWNKHIISLIDTPGDQNFFSDTKTCKPAADAAVIVVDSCSGSDIRTDLSLFDPSWSAERLVATIDVVLFNGTMSEKTGAELTAFLKAGKINPHRIRDALGLAVASPQFQEY